MTSYKLDIYPDILLDENDLTYLGGFRVPQGGTEPDVFWYGGSGLAYNPENNSLFIVGHINYNKTAEITIPALVDSATIGNLNTASFEQNFTDALEGTISDIDPTETNPIYIGGQYVYDGELYISAYSYYDADINASKSHWVRPLNLSTTGQLTGPVIVGGTEYQGFYSGYMFEVPAKWQSPLGGPVMCGGCCWPGASWQSQGPSANTFDPADIGVETPVPAIELQGYPYPNDLGPGGSTTNAVYNLTTRVNGAVFPEGSKSVLFFGKHGTGTYCYGTVPPCTDLVDTDQGTHAYPYKYQVWAYNADDMVKVKNGEMEIYDMYPYSIWNLTFPNESDSKHEVGGVAYDSENRIIYISVLDQDATSTPLIHAFSV